MVEMGRINTIKEEEKEDNVVDLKVLQGGKEPPSGDTWLDRMETGSVFYARQKNRQEFLLPLFHIAGRDGRVTYLTMEGVVDEKGEPKPMPVCAIDFINRFDMYQLVTVLIQNKEEENGNGDRNEGDD